MSLVESLSTPPSSEGVGVDISILPVKEMIEHKKKVWVLTDWTHDDEKDCLGVFFLFRVYSCILLYFFSQPINFILLFHYFRGEELYPIQEMGEGWIFQVFILWSTKL